MLIKGYDYGPLVPGERLLERAGFWSNHLLSMCRFTSGGSRPAPEWFGDDGADADALSDALLDERVWPTFRLPFGARHCAVVVFRNLVGDFGIDYLLTHPDWARAEVVSSFDGDWYGPGLSWRDLAHIAAMPDTTAPGVHDPAARRLLLLPLLAEDGLSAEVPALVTADLTAIGASADSAPDTADHLLANRRPAARSHGGVGSPLSGGRPRRTEADASAVLWALNLTRPQSDALAAALGSGPLPSSGLGESELPRR